MVERRKAAYASASRFSGVNERALAGGARVRSKNPPVLPYYLHPRHIINRSARLEIALRSESHLSSARPTIPPKLQILNAKIHEREVTFL